MKNRIFTLVIAVILVLCALNSCNIIFGDVDESGDVTVVVENSDGTYDIFAANLESVENKKEGAKGILEHLSQRNDGLNLEMVDSTYGAYVTAVGNIKEDVANKMYVIVYTSVSADSYEGAPTLNYNGVTLYQAGLGLSGMTVEEGTVILFRLEKSPY